MASPILGEVLAFVALGVLSLVVLLILRYYLPLRTTPAFYLAPIFLSLWLPAGIVLLVPVDLASSATIDDEAARGIWLPGRVLLVSWKITYWLTFALVWFFLPLLAEYADAGYREPRDKLIYSLRGNAQYHATVAGIAGLGLAYVFIMYGASFLLIKGIAMALAYCWGLVLAIYLMGHGLVSIPRALFRNASLSGRLRRLQIRAPRLYEQCEDAIMQLRDVEAQISVLYNRKATSPKELRDWIEELADMAELPETALPTQPRHEDGPEIRTLPVVITKKYMADLSRRLARARQLRSRYDSEWASLLRDDRWIQSVMNSAASRSLGPTSQIDGDGHGPMSRVSTLTPFLRHILHYYLMPCLRIALGVILAAASVSIVWSEVVKVGPSNLSIIRLTVVHYWDGSQGQVGFFGQVMASLWIMYMCAAALTSVTEVRVWRGRALVRRLTAHESALWYAAQVAKLTIPLSYNFLTLLSPRIYKQTAFYDFLGRLIDLTRLGSWFDLLFPVFILFPVCATLFGLYGRVKRFFGFGTDTSGNDESRSNSSATNSDLCREGRDLIQRHSDGQYGEVARLDSTAWKQRISGAPVLSVPLGTGSGRFAASIRSPLSPASPGPGFASAARRAGRVEGSRAAAMQGEGETETENVLQVFGHRVRNTLDSLESPRWLHDWGQGFKKLNWMAAPAATTERAAAGRGSDSAGANVRRWFGGGSREGRIRLV